MCSSDQPTFEQLGLPTPILQALQEIGYEQPSPIQQNAIPPLLEGRDILGQAQTGTGKTAAFALPLISRLDLSANHPQLLVLAPTRELAIQVAEAFDSYGKHLKNFRSVAIYGGQAYDGQLRALKRGAQVVVGTPGRVMDHIERGSLKLDRLQSLVLDEADEMLRMGFIDDVEWVLKHTPEDRQIALFSATMPSVIKRVATEYLTDPVEVKIASETTTATTITQRYWRVSGLHKLDALSRILEAGQFDAMLIFVRTKSATVELAEQLNSRGYAADALNGDISQQLRERTVERLKQGKLDILVATDVVARGLDVERISCVLNYDIPYDAESYVHRIGRTGRAGRKGEAILFVSGREQRMLRTIERATRHSIEPMELPSGEQINQLRRDRFKNKLMENLAGEGSELALYRSMLAELQQEFGIEALDLAAAMAYQQAAGKPFLLSERPIKPPRERRERDDRERGERGERPNKKRRERGDGYSVDMQRYRLAVGYQHGVKPGNIVGAIANEANIDSRYIGAIEITDECSFVDLPAGMPDDVKRILKQASVCGQKLKISAEGEMIKATAEAAQRAERGDRPPRRNGKKGKKPGNQGQNRRQRS